MSPRGLVSLLVWALCFGVLFAGLAAWKRHVDARDRARRVSISPFLQRGDLPGDAYRVEPGAEDGETILGSVIRSTGTTASARLVVTHLGPPATRIEMVYLLYASAARAEAARESWERMLGLPPGAAAAHDGAATAYETIASVRQRQRVLLIVQAPQAHGTPDMVRDIVRAADERLARWLRFPRVSDTFPAP